MNIITSFLSQMKTSAGFQQSFRDRVNAGNISGALELMHCTSRTADKYINEYNPESHEIMKRPDKATYDEDGNFTGWVKRWKLPLNYHQYINEIALAFLYGRPVKWEQQSDNTDEAFEAFTDFIRTTHFDARVREAKRLAGAERTSALLFYTFKNNEGKAECLIKVIAKSLGDDIYYIKDQYDRVLYFARGYYITSAEGSSNYRIDIFMDDFIYECIQGTFGWKINKKRNYIGKKPFILFEQEEEWHGAQAITKRQEYMKSRTADVNDYMADPALVATADVIQNMPEKDQDNKMYIIGKDGKLEYLMPDAASNLKKDEMEDNERHIFRETFTPDIDFMNMLKISGNISGVALDKILLLAKIKANKRKETHDEYMTRTSNLIIAILRNVTNIGLAAQLDRLKVSHQFQNPFADDIKEVIENLSKAYSDGGISQETYIEKNPMIDNAMQEKRRVAEETAKREELQKEQNVADIFNPNN